MTRSKKPSTKLSPAGVAALAAMQALPSADVLRQPSYRVQRASWLRALLLPIVKDHAGLLDAPLDPPLESAELTTLPELVELLGETAAGKQADVAAPVLTPEELTLLAALRVEQGKLDRAFRVRLRGDRAGRRLLSDIRAGEAGDPEDMLSDARRLVALADSDANKSWVARLKKGEPAALEALREAIPRLKALATRAAGAAKGVTGRDQMRRAWTLALRIAERVVTAGQYHTHDLPGRAGDYTRFRAPTARKSRKK